MQSKGIDRIAVLAFGAGNETPIKGIGVSERQRSRHGEELQLYIVLELDVGAARRFNDHAQIAFFIKRVELFKCDHLGLHGVFGA